MNPRPAKLATLPTPTLIRALGLAVGLAMISGGLPAAVSAETRSYEAVGSVPVSAAESGTTAARKRAIAHAIDEAVGRTAAELLEQAEISETSEANAGHPPLDELLGSDLSQYASSFRVREDRGERPALFAEDPAVATEYVVIVEVEVDVDRVQRRLTEAGVLAPVAPSGNRVEVSVEILGIADYAAFATVRELLAKASGGSRGASEASVSPLEIERGRARFGVSSELDASRLLQRLIDAAPEGLSLSTVRADRHSLTLRVRDERGGARGRDEATRSFGIPAEPAP